MQYWVVTSGIFLGATLVIYIPIKIIGYRMWDKYHHQLRWLVRFVGGAHFRIVYIGKLQYSLHILILNAQLLKMTINFD